MLSSARNSVLTGRKSLPANVVSVNRTLVNRRVLIVLNPSTTVVAGSSISTTTATAQTSQQVASQTHLLSQESPEHNNAEATREWEKEMEELFKLINLLPPSVRSHIEEHPRMPELLEVVMDLGRPPLARFPEGDVRLGEGLVTTEDLELAVAQVGDFGGDNRAGIDRTLHRISCIRNRSGKIIGLTCRVGRAIQGSARLVSDLVLSGASILFLGRPGVGKTTVIREVSRALADELQKRVVIVDTSNEIGGDGDIPHEGIGRARRIQVPHPDKQHNVMIEAVENHMPQVVVIDEIGTEAECTAARTIAQRGVQLVATAHGNELENVVKNPSLSDLVGGIQSVTLGDDEARKRGVQKSILERGAPPTFDVCVEMLERNKWRVHLDVAQAVDLLLAGGAAGGQVRERLADGSITKYTHDPAVSTVLSRPTKDFSSTSAKAARAAAAAALAAAEAEKSMSGIARNMGGAGNARGASVATSSRDGSPSASFSSSPSSSSSAAAMKIAASFDEADEGEMPAAVAAAASNKFTKRSIQESVEQAALEAETGLEEDGVVVQVGARRLANRQALLGIQPDTAVLRLFPYELDADKLWEVMKAMDLTQKVLIVRRVAQADAVLGLRTKVKTDAALRTSAKSSRVPIYAIKQSSTSSLVRALRTLLGIDPVAGGTFVRGGAAAGDDQSSNNAVQSSTDQDEESAAAVQSAAVFAPVVSDSAGQPVLGGSLRAELDIASVRQRKQELDSSNSNALDQVLSSSRSPMNTPAARAATLKQAVEEARAACEQLVMPLNQAVELLPRALYIIEEQQKIVDEYGLGWQILGSGADMRLRVTPNQPSS